MKGKKKAAEGSAEQIEETREKFPSGFQTMDVKITDSPFHKKGEVVTVGRPAGEKMIRKGWAEQIAALIVALCLFGLPNVNAQSSYLSDMYNSLGTNLTSDTVTNGGTGAVTSRRISTAAGANGNVTIMAIATELSGTTAGTITVQGSLDGVTFKAIPTVETQTGITTATALDVAGAQPFTWRLSSSPYLYYRVSWTGSGTMSATLSAKIMKH